MAAPDFPASPTVGQTYTAPSGNVYTWDGAVWKNSTAAQNAYWSDAGTSLTPAVATKTLWLQGQGDPNSIVMSRRAARGRLISNPVNDAHYWTANDALNMAGTAWVQDDATKPSWIADIDLNADAFFMYRGPSSGGALVPVFSIENGGSYVYLGGTRPRPMIQAYAGSMAMHANFAWAPDDTTMPSWTAYCRPDTDQFVIYRRAPNAAAGTVTAPFNIDSGGITHCTLANYSVTQTMLGNSATVRSAAATNPGGWSSPNVNAWNSCCSVTVNCPFANAPVFYFSSLQALAYVGNGNVYYAVARDGGILWQSLMTGYTGGGPLQIGFAGYDNGEGAGNHSYAVYLYVTNGAVAFTNGSTGLFSAWVMS